MSEQEQIIYRSIDSIGSRLLIAFVLIVLLSAAIISGVSAASGLQTERQQVIDQLESVATLKEAEIKTWLNRLETNLPAMLAGKDAMQRANTLLRASSPAESYQDAHDELQGRFRQAMEQVQLFEEVFLMDLQGRALLSTDTTQEGKVFDKQVYFQQGLKGAYVHPPSYSPLLGRMEVVTVQPVIDRQGDTVGILAGRASLTTLNEIMLERTGLGETGETYLVGANHARLSRPALAIQGEEARDYVRTEGANAALDEHIDGSGSYDGHRGSPVIGVYRWLPELQVALLAEQEQSEAFRGAYTTLCVNLSVTLLSVMLALAASFLITRSIANPLAELSRTAARIASGDRDARAPVERRDEIGALSDTFNWMVESIQQAEEALRDSEARYRRLADNAKDMIYCMSLPDGRYEYASPASIDMFGYSPQEFYDSPILIQHIIHPEWHGYFEEQWANLLAGNMPPIYEYQIIHKSGETRWMYQRNVLVCDDDGQPIAIEGIVTDITERKQAEEQLKKYRDHLAELVEARTAELEEEITERVRVELVLQEQTHALRQAKHAAEDAQRAAEAANRAKSAFLANMSHELRTPLNAILGFTQIMRRDSAFAPSQRDNLRIIHRSGEHLLELINDVLEMSKIEAGRATFTENDFDLYQLLATLESMFGMRAQNNGVQIYFERTPDVPQHIRTDERKLHQVLINLLSNAIKFTEEGNVTLRVKRVGSGELAPTAGRHLAQPQIGTCRLAFEVEDTGVGIAPEEMDRLFEAFTQTNSGQDVLQGTGLGLPLSQRFVQLMGGDISVSSKVGKGSLFRFDIQVGLPADVSEIEKHKKIQERVVGLVPEQMAAGDVPYRILVVEDREASRALLLQLLTDVGFEVREAVNGQEAVAVWQAWKPHLIWMDMRMPVMDGYEATELVKSLAQAQAGSPPVPVIIALTAHAFEEERAAILAVGCDDFVRKPFRESEIFAKMAQHLGVRYIYQDLAPDELDGDVQAQVNLTPSDLADLPAAWVIELRHAAGRGRANRILGVIEQIQPGHARVAEGLAVLVHEFRFDRIMALTKPPVNQEEK